MWHIVIDIDGPEPDEAEVERIEEQVRTLLDTAGFDYEDAHLG